MKVTFLEFMDYEDLRSRSNSVSKYFHAGFGTGRNITHVMKVDNKIYLQLSPIADPAYSNTSQELKNEQIIHHIERLVG